MNSGLSNRLLLGVPGLALVAVIVAVLLEEPNADRLLNATLAGVGLVLVWAVAVAVRLRYPDRPLGTLLFLLAGAYAIQTLLSSPNPYLFTLARAARPAVEVLLVWVMLAFPSGRLQGWRERYLMASSALALMLLWLPSLMLSPSIPLVGPFVVCHPQCPRNVLFVADWSELSRALNTGFRIVGAFILMAAGALLFSRLRQATPLLRRALAPVLFASIARTLAIASFLISDSAWPVLTLTFWAIPLAIALGLLRERLYKARALQELVTGLRARPDTHQLRDVMARALGDDTLSIAYWLKERECWVDADGEVLALPYPSAEHGRAATMVSDADGRPVAALVHDIALLEDPSLVEAFADSMQLALESHRLDAEIKTSSARSASAVEAERHRIERDLHDGAQQRLIALRMKLSVTARLFDQDPRLAQALVQEMGADVEAAMIELRALAHGIAPPLLTERGLGAALSEAAQHAALPMRVTADGVGRCDPVVERAVYFCCLEALQNAAKHAGANASVRLTLEREGEVLHFCVDDDGSAPTSTGVAHDGQGLANMRERIKAIGGQLDFETARGQGFRVVGTVRAPER